jgi:hypothetical protein
MQRSISEVPGSARSVKTTRGVIHHAKLDQDSLVVPEEAAGRVTHAPYRVIMIPIDLLHLSFNLLCATPSQEHLFSLSA